MFGFMDILVTIIFLILYSLWKQRDKSCVHRKSESEPEEDDDKQEFINKCNIQETLSECRTSIIDAQKNNLETASQQWKKRIGQNDAINFSVAGRMHQEVKEISESVLNIANNDRRKRTPKANRFRSKDGKFSLYFYIDYILIMITF